MCLQLAASETNKVRLNETRKELESLKVQKLQRTSSATQEEIHQTDKRIEELTEETKRLSQIPHITLRFMDDRCFVGDSHACMVGRLKWPEIVIGLPNNLRQVLFEGDLFRTWTKKMRKTKGILRRKAAHEIGHILRMLYRGSFDGETYTGAPSKNWNPDDDEDFANCFADAFCNEMVTWNKSIPRFYNRGLSFVLYKLKSWIK